jgi:hypothetical protein
MLMLLPIASRSPAGCTYRASIMLNGKYYKLIAFMSRERIIVLYEISLLRNGSELRNGSAASILASYVSDIMITLLRMVYCLNPCVSYLLSA